MCFNISRETKIATVLGLEKFPHGDINDLFGHFPSVVENSVYLCNKFFNLPDYMDMSAAWDAQHNNVLLKVS